MADIEKMRLLPLSVVGEGIEKKEPYKVYNVYWYSRKDDEKNGTSSKKWK